MHAAALIALAAPPKDAAFEPNCPQSRLGAFCCPPGPARGQRHSPLSSARAAAWLRRRRSAPDEL